MITRRKRKIMVVGLLILLSLFSIYINIAIGTNNYGFDEIKSAITGVEEGKNTLIITQVRFPRALTAYFVGASLAIAGLIIQSITQNKLTSAQILGVNSGVSFITIFVAVYLPAVSYVGKVGLGCIAALIVVIAVLKVSQKSGSVSVANLPLSGLVIGVFLSSLTQSILLLNEESAETMMFYMMGSFIKSTWESVAILIPISIICICIVILLAKVLQVMELGKDMAISIGINVKVYLMLFIVLVALLAGVSVAVAGPIGFIGIIVPNLIRKIEGQNYRVTVILTALFGGLLASLSDVVSKFISYPHETPVGIVISFIGVPIFLYVAMSERSKREA